MTYPYQDGCGGAAGGPSPAPGPTPRVAPFAILETESQRLVRILEDSAGWVPSFKSQAQPTQAIQRVGKSMDGARHTLASSPASLSSLVAGWIGLAASQYARRR